MSEIVKKLPQWLLIVIALYLMGLVAYSVHNGATVRFWPPEIIPRLTAIEGGIPVLNDVKGNGQLLFSGELSSADSPHPATAKVHRFLLGSRTTIVVQPQEGPGDGLYFDLTIQSPSGRLSSVGRFQSTKDSASFPFEATESGEHLLIVSMRADGDKDVSGGRYIVSIRQ